DAINDAKMGQLFEINFGPIDKTLNDFADFARKKQIKFRTKARSNKYAYAISLIDDLRKDINKLRKEHIIEVIFEQKYENLKFLVEELRKIADEKSRE